MTLIAGTQEALLNEGDLAGPHGFTWGFVALEYYALIANRVLAVLATPHDLVVVRAGGSVMAPHHLTEAWYNPYAYLEERVLSRYAPMGVGSDELLKVDRANRRIPWKTITAVTFAATRKWEWDPFRIPEEYLRTRRTSATS